jgi:uroporphyrinogen-III synthase
MRLLVTRPEEDGERTAATLRARGHDVLLAPLLRIAPIPADFGPGPFAAVLTTSANAARAVAQHARIAELRELPLFTVGQRSAAAARTTGFVQVVSADGDAPDLVALIGRQLAGAAAPLLYLAGEDRAADVAGDLARHGLKVRTAAVYRALAAETFPPPVAAALGTGGLDGVLHYSPRSAVIFLRCAEIAGLIAPALKLAHYCLSAQVAAPLIEAGAGIVRVAPRPEEATLIEAVGSAS